MCAHTEKPSNEEILTFLVNSIFTEITRVKVELDIADQGKQDRRSLFPKQKQKLRYALRDLSLALATLLEQKPEETTEEELKQIINRVIPKKYRRRLNLNRVLEGGP